MTQLSCNCGQNKDCCPFRKVVIPASAGDDSVDSPCAPENGAYRNALVEYEANGAMYIYASDGIFTKVSMVAGGSGTASVQYVDGKVSDEAAARASADNAIRASMPTKTSQLTNDSGFVETEHDPVFEASPAGSITSTDVSNWNNKSDFSGSYNDLTDKPTIPAAQIQSDWEETNSASKAFIRNKPVIPPGSVVDTFINPNSSNPVQNSAIADALNNKQGLLSEEQTAAVNSGITLAKVTTYDGYATTIAGKADASSLATVATSGSYNDLSNKPTIPAAQIQSDWTQTTTTAKDYIKNKPNLAAVATSGAYADLSGTPSLATVATSGSYNDLSNKPTIPAAQVNSNWNATSGVAQILNKPTLAAVATSGSYNDLTNKPTIPSGQIQSDWTQTNNAEVDYIKNKPNLATVATSGSYADLSNKPTIPTVNNATLTITQNGTSVGTFTANASSNKTIAVTDTTYSDATTSASGLMSSTDKTKLNGIATGAEVNVQSDWNQTTTTADDYIKNKPTVPVITMTSTDPGEGGTLAADNFIGVYS